MQQANEHRSADVKIQRKDNKIIPFYATKLLSMMFVCISACFDIVKPKSLAQVFKKMTIYKLQTIFHVLNRLSLIQFLIYCHWWISSILPRNNIFFDSFFISVVELFQNNYYTNSWVSSFKCQVPNVCICIRVYVHLNLIYLVESLRFECEMLFTIEIQMPKENEYKAKGIKLFMITK